MSDDVVYVRRSATGEVFLKGRENMRYEFTSCWQIGMKNKHIDCPANMKLLPIETNERWIPIGYVIPLEDDNE